MGLIDRLFGKSRGSDHLARRAEDLTRIIAQIDNDLASERDRITVRAHQSNDDAAMGNILIATVYEKMGQSPPAGSTGLKRVEELQAQRAKLEAELTQVRDALAETVPIPPTVRPKRGCCPHCGALLMDEKGQLTFRLAMSTETPGTQGVYVPGVRQGVRFRAIRRAETGNLTHGWQFPSATRPTLSRRCRAAGNTSRLLLRFLNTPCEFNPEVQH